MPTRPSVIILTPSRGLIHSRTVAAVLAAERYAVYADVADVHGWLITHDLPIPSSHEHLAVRGMARGADFLWFVEEDMVPPVSALAVLLCRQQQTGAGVVFLDYPVGEQPTRSAILRQPDGSNSILYGGLGCTLIHRSVLEALPRPWFETAHEYRLTRDAATGRYTLTETDVPATYGGLDVAFCRKALAQGFTLAAVESPNRAGHARLRTLGTRQDNHGTHTIDVLTGIEA